MCVPCSLSLSLPLSGCYPAPCAQALLQGSDLHTRGRHPCGGEPLRAVSELERWLCCFSLTLCLSLCLCRLPIYGEDTIKKAQVSKLDLTVCGSDHGWMGGHGSHGFATCMGFVSLPLSASVFVCVLICRWLCLSMSVSISVSVYVCLCYLFTCSMSHSSYSLLSGSLAHFSLPLSIRT